MFADALENIHAGRRASPLRADARAKRLVSKVTPASLARGWYHLVLPTHSSDHPGKQASRACGQIFSRTQTLADLLMADRPHRQVSVATSLANLTSLVGNRMMPTPLDPNELTRNKVKAEENRNDRVFSSPVCVGLRLLMLIVLTISY